MRIATQAYHSNTHSPTYVTPQRMKDLLEKDQKIFGFLVTVRDKYERFSEKEQSFANHHHFGSKKWFICNERFSDLVNIEFHITLNHSPPCQCWRSNKIFPSWSLHPFISFGMKKWLQRSLYPWSHTYSIPQVREVTTLIRASEMQCGEIRFNLKKAFWSIQWNFGKILSKNCEANIFIWKTFADPLT